ncbi:MAG: hypothetical protein ACREJX_08970 [Polyangiaceae bacterium]
MNDERGLGAGESEAESADGEAAFFVASLSPAGESEVGDADAELAGESSKASVATGARDGLQ